MTRRAPGLQRRPSRTVPASIAAGVLTVAGVLIVLVGVWRLIDGTWPAPAQAVLGYLAKISWGSTGWLIFCIGAAVLGLIMIIAGATPGRYNAARIGTRIGTGSTPGTTPETEFVISRRGIARLAAAHADLVDGVESVTVKAGARRVRVSVGTTSRHTGDIAQAVTVAVQAALTDAGLSPVPRINTTAWTKEI
ncbi:DUF6286 domain-containing protein [Microlunatus sp. Gsoil 973]|uniref:DUF6286 domain-containing protein n=1 Tax=Microlunatus sp. Gsoil 973 TaxID=2672569 RepID=UPI0012B4A49B|nr:DUF6286 domain-containing protein [Microlunatus sp. Gsoil 973]QGN32104.1 hypothetical protein GJV80_04060 [Microlunatus sp. Gsoil 973]